MKRAAGILELFMTYGWAILVVVIILGTLLYFGILERSELLPSKCYISDNFKCSDHRIDLDNQRVNLRITNSRDQGIMITKIKLSDVEGDFFCMADITTSDYVKTSKSDFRGSYGSNVGWHIDSLQWDDVSVPCQKFTGMHEGKVVMTLEFVYFLDDAGPEFAHVAKGELISKPQSVEI